MQKKISTLWCGLLLSFAIYTLVASRGKIDLKKQIGPKLSLKKQATNFTFAIFGDPHSCRISLREILLKSQSRSCNFALLLGDFVEFDDEFEYRYFLNRTKPYLKSMPLFLVRGNHETMAPGGGFSKNFLKYIPDPFLYKLEDEDFAFIDIWLNAKCGI